MPGYSPDPRVPRRGALRGTLSFCLFLDLEAWVPRHPKAGFLKASKAKQCKAMQSNGKQCKAMQSTNAKQYKQCNATQSKGMQGNTKQCKAVQNNAKKCKAMQCNAKHQCKAIQSNAMQRYAKHAKQYRALGKTVNFLKIQNAI